MAEEGQKVSLHMYDLTHGLARELSMSVLGKNIEAIWHTGVVVYGTEYYYGGGIQQVVVGTAPHGTPMRVVDLGVTHIPKDVFESYLDDIAPRYTQESYSLMEHNCNNFSSEVAQFLVGSNIPEYILNLPIEVKSSPMAGLIMPMIQNLETTLKAGAVPQGPQFMQTPAYATPLVTSNQGMQTPVVDPLADAKRKVKEEVEKEFAAVMGSGTFRASEAAVTAVKKVMQKYGIHI